MSDIMTVDDVRKRIADIVAMAGDPEAAHTAEDALWADVLAAIAGGHSNASLLAKEALKTSAIEFARWCA